MKITEYRRLLAELVRGARDDCDDRDLRRRFAGWGREILEQPAGRALVAAYPSVATMRIAARRHLVQTLGLDAKGLRLGRARMELTHRPLTRAFEPSDDMNAPVKLPCQFSVPFVARTRAGLYRDRMLVEKGTAGVWHCRTEALTRRTIELAASAHGHYTVELRVRDRVTALAVLDEMRERVLAGTVCAAWPPRHGRGAESDRPVRRVVSRAWREQERASLGVGGCVETPLLPSDAPGPGRAQIATARKWWRGLSPSQRRRLAEQANRLAKGARVPTIWRGK